MSKFFQKNETILFLILLLLLVFLSFYNPQFYSIQNINSILRSSSTVMIVAFGMTILLTSGEVDLSVGALLSFVTVIVMDVINISGSLFLGFLSVFIFCFLIGLINGLVRTVLNVNSLIGTLAMMLILQGSVYIYSMAAIYNTHLIPAFTFIGQGFVYNVPMPVIIMLVILPIFVFLLNYTRYGRYFTAIGSNPFSSNLSGINNNRYKLIGFIITSLLVGIAGIILASLMDTGQQGSAKGFELIVIAAVLLGGTSFKGGSGTILGTILGILILKVIDNGIILMSIPQEFQLVVPGVILILAVYFDTLRKEKMDNNFKSLTLKNIKKEFPGVLALDDVSLEAKAGSVHALMGENGAGKSTLIKILAGAYSKDHGTILFDDKEVNIDNPNDSLNLGIKVVYQEIALIPEFTVGENIFFEKFPVNSLGIVNWKKLYNDCNNLLKKIGFNLNVKEKVVNLSISEQQIVEIARAIFQNASVVVMDEPTSSLTPNEIEKLFEVIENLKKNNIAIIYITHKIDEIFKIANEVTVLRDGKLISHRDIKDTSEEILIQDMVGRKVEQKFDRPIKSFDKVLMNINNISTKSKLKDISFNLYKGEILGFFGLMGAGRTELAKAIYGYDNISNGSIEIDGQTLKKFNTQTMVKNGVGYVTEDRKGEGIIKDMNLRENMSLPSLEIFEKLFTINKNKEKKISNEYIDKFEVKTPSSERLITLLSGGNQQKILLSRWLIRNLKIIILDEPTRGVDIGAKTEILRLINDLAKDGLSVILMTSEMNDLLTLSDRIIVMAGGKISKEFDRNEATQEEIFKASVI